MRNMDNILRHELIGLECHVESSKNKSQTGIEGKVTDETIKTLVIGDKRVQKKDATFVVKLNGKKVHIDGNAIIARPEDRIKKKIRKW
ncbi:MAG: ribonuclease P protein subunit [Candidatus Aenigmatarchaeota archaeon]